MRHDIDTGATATTPANAPGVLPGTFDTSTPGFGTAAAPHDFTLYCTCTGLAAGAVARVSIEDSVLGTFADAQPLAVFHFSGPIGAAEMPGGPNTGQVEFVKRAYELPAAAVALAASKLRVNVLTLTAAGALSAHAQIDC